MNGETRGRTTAVNDLVAHRRISLELPAIGLLHLRNHLLGVNGPVCASGVVGLGRDQDPHEDRLGHERNRDQEQANPSLERQ